MLVSAIRKDSGTFTPHPVNSTMNNAKGKLQDTPLTCCLIRLSCHIGADRFADWNRDVGSCVVLGWNRSHIAYPRMNETQHPTICPGPASVGVGMYTMTSSSDRAHLKSNNSYCVLCIIIDAAHDNTHTFLCVHNCNRLAAMVSCHPPPSTSYSKGEAKSQAIHNPSSGQIRPSLSIIWHQPTPLKFMCCPLLAIPYDLALKCKDPRCQPGAKPNTRCLPPPTTSTP